MARTAFGITITPGERRALERLGETRQAIHSIHPSQGAAARSLGLSEFPGKHVSVRSHARNGRVGRFTYWQFL